MSIRPKIEFELNKPTELELIYDKPVEGNGKYGHYQIYAVRRLEDSSEYSWFAPEYIHKQIQDKGLMKNDKFIITKGAKDVNGKLVNDYKISFVPYAEANRVQQGDNEAFLEEKAAPLILKREDTRDMNKVWEDKDRRIAREACLHSASRIVAAEIQHTGFEFKDERVVELAELMFNWVYEKEEK